MLEACDIVLDAEKTKKPVTKEQKWEIGCRAAERVWEEMGERGVQWMQEGEGDEEVRNWVRVALGCFATYVVSQWKVGVNVHRKAQAQAQAQVQANAQEQEQAAKGRGGETQVLFGVGRERQTAGSSADAGIGEMRESAETAQRQLRDRPCLKPIVEEEVSTNGRVAKRTKAKAKKSSSRTMTMTDTLENEAEREKL
ncbi:hypothetical protein IFR05_017521, partial [Cadophora sp. M221]